MVKTQNSVDEKMINIRIEILFWFDSELINNILKN